MKKTNLLIMIILLLTLSLAACGSSNKGTSTNENNQENEKFTDQPSKEGGYVISVGEEGLTVVDAQRDKLDLEEGEREFYDTISYSYPNASDEVKLGQRVLVEHTGDIAESFPSQATAKAVEVLPEYKPKGANLTESEVIQKALETTDQKSNWTPAFREVIYDSKSGVWKVSVLQGEEQYELEIEDQESAEE